MVIVLILGLFLFATSVVLLVRGLTLPRRTGAVHQIGSYGFTGSVSQAADHEPTTIADVAGQIGARLGRLKPMAEEQMRDLLVGAGIYRTSPDRLLGYQAFGSVLAALTLLSLTRLADAGTLTLVVSFVFGALIGWLAPMSYVRLRNRERRARIEYELPDLIDLLVVSIEAGVSFPAAVRLSAKRVSGPLGQELRLALQEQSMGLSTTEALENMLRRVDTPGLRIFVRSLAQGERLGVSIGQTMRTVAEEMRKRRRALAEERAHKAPVKMLFPLVFFVLPALFVVLLLPTLLTITETLGG